jgi:hypothetical protein
MSVLREIAQKVKELLDELEKLPQEETDDFEYPFKIGDTCFFINVVGEPAERKWSNYVHEENAYKQGNIFKTKQEVYKERDKRELLMRFKQFRDKCNGEWKPPLKVVGLPKYCIAINNKTDVMFAMDVTFYNEFNPFGYFKKKDDCNRAIQLFGDEIKRLYVEE